MTQVERELILGVADGHHPALTTIYQFKQICDNTNDIPFLYLLRWLKNNKITGRNISLWVHSEHEGSFLYAVQFIRRKLTSDVTYRVIKSIGV